MGKTELLHGTRIRDAAARGVVALASASVLASVAAMGVVVTASADPVTDSVEQAGDALLYRSGLQVYEVAAVRPAPDTSPPAQELVLRRVHEAGDGIAGAPRYAFVGTPLPEAFVVAEAWQQPGVPSGVIIPADPDTLEKRWSDADLTMVSIVAGPVGPLAGAGMSSPYLG